MLDFDIKKQKIIFHYNHDFGNSVWVANELKKHGKVTISRVFRFQRKDLIGELPVKFDQELEETSFQFQFAKKSGDYYRIPGRILGIKNDVFLAEEEIDIERKLFVAERNINIFGHIAKLRPDGEDIVVGGDRDGCIPADVFRVLLSKFPNTGEMNRYARARVETVVGDYFDEMRTARDNYEAYLNKQKSTVSDKPLPHTELLQLEIDKYVYLRDTIKDWLKNEQTRSEHDWQKMIIKIILLIFPKYIAVLENVQIADYYSKPGKKTNRFIDVCLVDVVGNIDIIEIKKPFENGVLGKQRYRDNYVPTRELSGAVMQTEKYIFHLSKWGVDGERQLTKKHHTALPDNLSIRVTNPKGLIIVGRDDSSGKQAALGGDQLFDFEIIKRKYANMMDILTYDDLLRRLNNIISSLSERKENIT